MSDFHCPLSVRAYHDEGCIDCGLCIARDMKESLEASKKMEEYLKKTNGEKDKRPIQKICVTGKGGVGKTTISSVLARLFEKKGYDVLVLDTDESNPGLYKKLGMSDEPKPLISFLDRFGLEYGIPEDTWISKDEITFDDNPDEFLVRKGNIRLMETGKINNAFQGCACSMADFSRQLMKNLKPSDDQIVIADLEAGVESFGRGIEQGSDTIFAVTETSLDSMKLAEDIKRMSNGIGIRRVYTIFNRIPEGRMEELMGKISEEYDIEPVCTLTYDEDVMVSGFSGEPVPEEIATYGKISKMLEEVFV